MIMKNIFSLRFIVSALLMLMCSSHVYGVVPVLIGPLQVLLAMLPAILMGLLGLVISILKPSAVKKGLKLLWKQKVPVGIVVLGIVGFVYGYKKVFPRRETFSDIEQTSHMWPMFRGGPGRRGSVPGCRGPVRGAAVWTFSDEVKTFYASPAIVGNRLYISSSDKGPFTDKGAIYCIDTDTGGVVWKCAPENFRATFSSPSVSGKYLVCGEGLHFTKDARIVCLDLENNGKLLWEYRTASHVESSPCIYGDRVYIGAGDDGYYCFELEPDSSGKPVMIWHAEGDTYPDAETPPAVREGKVYVGLGMGGKGVCCFDAENGKEIWRTDTPYPVFTPPTLAQEKVFVGMGNGNYIQTAEAVKAAEIKKLKDKGASAEEIAEAEKSMGPAGEVWCLDAATGNREFSFKVSRTVLGAVAAGENGLYFGSRDGNLYGISYSGEEIGTWNAHAPIIASPAVADGKVYFVTASGILYGLDINSFRPVWETAVGTQGMFISSPVAARGHIYVGSEKDGLLCLGEPAGQENKPLWAGILGGPGRAGSIDGSPLPERGTFSWRYPDPDKKSRFADSAEETVISAPAASIGDAVYVPVASGPLSGVVCLALEEHGQKSIPREKWIFSAEQGIYFSPASNGEIVMCTDGKKGDALRHLYAADAETGEELWKTSVEKDASGFFVMTGHSVLVQDKPERLSAFDLQGKRLWDTNTGALSGVPSFTDSMVVCGSASAGISVLDSLTGSLLWQKPGLHASTGPVTEYTRIYAGTEKGAGAYRLTDGSNIWDTENGKPDTVLVINRDYVCYISEQGKLIILKKESGKRVARIPGALSAVPPVMSRDLILFARRGEIAYADLSKKKVSRWMKTSWLGGVVSPVIQSGSRVYFASEKRGFICARKRGR